MTSKMYRSAQGKMVDFGALALKNENVLAVTNDGRVNARGDRVDENNRVIDSKAAQVQRQMHNQSVVARDPAKTIKDKTAPVADKIPEPIAVQEDIIAGLDDVVNEPNPVKAETNAEVAPTSNEGLAAAIAKAKNKKAQ